MNKRKRLPIRKWLRALHRDIGYLAIGLTLVYALSGLAINHIEDWDPNFTPIDSKQLLPASLLSEVQLDLADSASVERSARAILTALDRPAQFDDAYAMDAQHLDITLARSTLYVDLEKGSVHEEGQSPRFLLRAANWLHLNRGKKAWTWIADGYAVFLLFLATSGLFMLPGKRGILGRGALLAAIGAAVPILYVTLSGGP